MNGWLARWSQDTQGFSFTEASKRYAMHPYPFTLHLAFPDVIPFFRSLGLIKFCFSWQVYASKSLVFLAKNAYYSPPRLPRAIAALS